MMSQNFPAICQRIILTNTAPLRRVGRVDVGLVGSQPRAGPLLRDLGLAATETPPLPHVCGRLDL